MIMHYLSTLGTLLLTTALLIACVSPSSSKPWRDEVYEQSMEEYYRADALTRSMNEQQQQPTRNVIRVGPGVYQDQVVGPQGTQRYRVVPQENALQPSWRNR